MDLEKAPKKTKLEIVSIKELKLSEDALRFGIEPGEYVQIVHKLPSGPVVIQKNQTQVAIGQELAKAIEVKVIN